eukprot:TRINITY_DN6666_c0_g1_i2.p1 TRINITY_DN6666_c0_g1~~TRINITY_DN6666_c0_g1_i2.p1  ORF type:complete len:340 (-),score=23.01 TRINITY_DN6666_c0_g1_i2:439-1323(-)
MKAEGAGRRKSTTASTDKDEPAKSPAVQNLQESKELAEGHFDWIKPVVSKEIDRREMVVKDKRCQIINLVVQRDASLNSHNTQQKKASDMLKNDKMKPKGTLTRELKSIRSDKATLTIINSALNSSKSSISEVSNKETNDTLPPNKSKAPYRSNTELFNRKNGSLKKLARQNSESELMSLLIKKLRKKQYWNVMNGSSDRGKLPIIRRRRNNLVSISLAYLGEAEPKNSKSSRSSKANQYTRACHSQATVSLIAHNRFQRYHTRQIAYQREDICGGIVIAGEEVIMLQDAIINT